MQDTPSNLKLQSVPVRYSQLRVGDEICFDYNKPGKHPPSRVGFVIGMLGPHAVLVWDYSLCDGPQYRTYRVAGMRNLARLALCEVNETPKSRLQMYRSAIEKFREFVRFRR